MTKPPSLEQSYLALVEFLLLSKRQIIEHGNRHDLTAMQAMALFLLDQPRPMHNLKETFNCDASNITGLVDGLEYKKLACRFVSPTDRRIKMVKLQRKGATLRASLLDNLTGPHSYILAKLTPEEVNSFIRLVQKITNPHPSTPLPSRRP